ncbi:MAG: 5'/3'-nucleotidase SurE [Elusimicrobia bacterium GWA2_61_42]|nr:MAG: 5'/3'-nucleotidase SurE [Elusimicrobia bacterium GWA2_61_42]OGR75123.1 MAG: 5'/3'-nucleotidase SurE [Elusimicrobia bacterium GWC2_61_25]
MEILITNDDGIYAEGIYALACALKKLGNVTVVAPDTQRSAVGHAITIADPLRVVTANRNGKFFGYAASGTPADCVKLGIKSIMKKRPDLVVSGINLGGNQGYNILYSGTVSGATEGALLGIPSLAVSLDTFTKPDFGPSAAFAVKIAAMMKKKKLPAGTLLNVNLPNISAAKIKGVRITNQSRTSFNDWFDKRRDPHGNTYYWMTGDFKPKDADGASDLNALRAGYISVTPIQFDLTDYKFVPELENWDIKP